MTTLAQLRKAALALPEVTEEPRAGAVAFVVRGTVFAAATTGGVVRLHLSADDAATVRAEHPTATPLARGETVLGAQVPLADVNGQQLNHWVRRAWFARAPKRLVDSVAATDSAAPGTVGDLPATIGAPATQALAGAGYRTLADVAEVPDATLLALHGVGPKAVRLLRAAAPPPRHGPRRTRG